jgi:hypothetical protein
MSRDAVPRDNETGCELQTETLKPNSLNPAPCTLNMPRVVLRALLPQDENTTESGGGQGTLSGRFL